MLQSFFFNICLLLFSRDALNLSKMSVKTFALLKKIYISNKCCSFGLSIQRIRKNCAALNFLFNLQLSCQLKLYFCWLKLDAILVKVTKMNEYDSVIDTAVISFHGLQKTTKIFCCRRHLPLCLFYWKNSHWY